MRKSVAMVSSVSPFVRQLNAVLALSPLKLVQKLAKFRDALCSGSEPPVTEVHRYEFNTFLAQLTGFQAHYCFYPLKGILQHFEGCKNDEEPRSPSFCALKSTFECVEQHAQIQELLATSDFKQTLSFEGEGKSPKGFKVLRNLGTLNTPELLNDALAELALHFDVSKRGDQDYGVMLFREFSDLSLLVHF